MNSQMRSISRSQYESENNSQYNDYLQAKIEALSRAWLEIDKNFDSEVDQQELLDFLDSRMKTTKKFDRGVAKEIFKLMDLDQNGKISVEEFIKRYISIEDEIRRDIRDYQKIYSAEKENNSKLYKLMMQHKNENLNEKGVGQNAKIILQISSIEFFKQIVGKLENISIKLKLDNQVAETSVVAFESKVFYKESFEL
jgi:hypothetical protein